MSTKNKTTKSRKPAGEQCCKRGSKHAQHCCSDCWGSGKQRLTPAVRLAAAEVLLAALKRELGSDINGRLRSLRCDAGAILSAIEHGNLTCQWCGGAGRTRYQAPGDGVERACETCVGSGVEQITEAQRMKAAELLAEHRELNRAWKNAAT